MAFVRLPSRGAARDLHDEHHRVAQDLNLYRFGLNLSHTLLYVFARTSVQPDSFGL
jgi:hypothetical protein